MTFDGYSAEVTSRTSTSMVVTVPPHAPGTVSVIVMTDGLERSAAILPGGFTYELTSGFRIRAPVLENTPKRSAVPLPPIVPQVPRQLPRKRARDSLRTSLISCMLPP